jgi:hypothetical protein
MTCANSSSISPEPRRLQDQVEGIMDDPFRLIVELHSLLGGPYLGTGDFSPDSGIFAIARLSPVGYCHNPQIRRAYFKAVPDYIAQLPRVTFSGRYGPGCNSQLLTEEFFGSPSGQ